MTTNRQETVAEIIAEMRSGGLEAWETPADGVFALRCADRIEAALKRERELWYCEECGCSYCLDAERAGKP